MRTPGLTLVAVLLAWPIGCAPSDRKPVFPVSGRLTYKGEPMAGARIGFHPLNTDSRDVYATGTAGPDGSYNVTTYLTDDGAPAGEYAVTIYWPGKRSQLAQPPEDTGLPPDRLNRAYADKTTTALRATVLEQPNTIDFKLP